MIFQQAMFDDTEASKVLVIDQSPQMWLVSSPI